ncbi:MAG: MFS transporter [bacterium]|nr:MFS transporter [bacterium]
MQTWLSLIKKDIRYLKYPLLLWVVLLITYLPIKTLLIYSMQGDFTFFALFQLMNFIKKALVVILVPLLVQTDPVVGDSPYWLTRPISWRDLFFAKISVIVLLFLALPLLGEFLRLMFNGLSVGLIFASLVPFAIRELGFILPIMLIAVITANFVNYVLAAIIPLSVMLMMTFSPSLVSDLLGSSSQTQLFSKMLVLGIFIIAVACSAILYQYLSRKTVRTVTFSILGFLLIPVLLNVWQLDFIRNPMPLLPANHPLVGDIFISTDSIIERISTSESGDNSQGTYSGAISYYLAPGKTHIQVESFNNIRLNTIKGEEVNLKERHTKGLMSFEDSGSLEKLSYMLDGSSILITPRDYDYQRHQLPNIMLNLSGKESNMIKNRGPFTYSAHIHFRLFNFKPIARLPLEVGASVGIDTNSVRVLEIKRERKEYIVTAQMNFLELHSPGLLKRRHPLERRQSRDDKWKFVLHNPVQKEVLLSSETPPPSISAYPFEIHHGEIRFEVPAGLTEQWFREAQLVVYKVETTARFIKRISLDNVYINDSYSRYENPSPKKKSRVTALLNKLQLPPNPTTSEVRNYLGTILKTNRDEIETEDLLMEKLVQIGNRHISLLVEMGDRFYSDNSLYAAAAINRLAAPGDKEIIIPALNKYPELMQTVERYNWIKDAKVILLQQLRQEPADFPEIWIKTAVKYGEPSFYPHLEKLLIRNEPEILREVYRDLRKLPGFDLSKVVTTVWNRSRYGRAAEVCLILPLILEYGESDALRIGTRLLSSGTISESERNKLWESLRRFTNYNGKAANLAAWYEKNKTNLHFDKKKKKFVVQNRAESGE